ncbi:hypothetical protein [Xenorhabdus griffiniae]|uniref:Uncharacterized protein n=1 Tax=Xenorhabdus griffiniae TaxID=351672 RepID=A0ABY9XNT3_9GAMM|nr:hypothetical protein [Xenorhabdus griffiniae]MBD1226836.1 hypothetical protein [Xenorhabdus griffiniae]MBE8586199.1 hypothetical protein [Xenorhabdus griffiniae]WMV74576.1 hypothetical protein QL128_03050 [Xenorhabdus griffiniae]WNH04255.1 hypothetical protein QL112_003055 [Xenorhabdus griffiniae]
MNSSQLLITVGDECCAICGGYVVLNETHTYRNQVFELPKVALNITESFLLRRKFSNDDLNRIQVNLTLLPLYGQATKKPCRYYYAGLLVSVHVH